ncbi:VDE lipocalin domain-containing protein [Aureococcus anophagefferens]|nr:VDE lipocalin domain-containing protein [Aureococcus anophagefferens]
MMTGRSASLRASARLMSMMTERGLQSASLRSTRRFSAIVCFMPKLSPTHVEGVVSKWLVSEGDAVEACDLVAHLGADDVYDGSDLTGVTMLLETHDDGVVAELLVNEGEPRPQARRSRLSPRTRPASTRSRPRTATARTARTRTPSRRSSARA